MEALISALELLMSWQSLLSWSLYGGREMTERYKKVTYMVLSAAVHTVWGVPRGLS